MSLLRIGLALLLTVSLIGCHSDIEHGYLRSGPRLTLAGAPQFSMERVRTASFRPGLPPTELAQVRLERWPKSMVSGDSPTDATMNWAESMVDATAIGPDIVHPQSDDALASLDSVHTSDAALPLDQTLASSQSVEAATLPTPKPITYRSPVVRIGVLDAFKHRLKSGHQVLENKANSSRDWCREIGESCGHQGAEFRTQAGEVWDEFNPQYWIESTCQSCGEHTREFSSTLRDRADDICSPDWIGPTRDRLSSAGDRLSSAGDRLSSAGDRLTGGLGEATEKLGRVKETFNKAADSLDNLQPLSDIRPAIGLPRTVPMIKPDLKGFLPPILKQKGQHPGPPVDDNSESASEKSVSSEVIELPPPGDFQSQSEAADKTDDASSRQAEAAEPKSSDDASSDSAESTRTASRRAPRKTDRWKSGLN
jgi:hypothetical protein